MEEKTRLNLGCGQDVRKGYVNVDIGDFNQEVYHDLNSYPYPFKDNSFSYVLMNHCIEHLDDTVKTMKELKRICKKGAIINLWIPYFSSPNMWGDPTHKRCFNWFTFERFDDFKIIDREFYYLSNNQGKHKSKILDNLINISPIFYERFLCYIFPCSELHVVLEVK